MFDLPGLDAFLMPTVSAPLAVAPVAPPPADMPDVAIEAHFKSVQKQLAKRSDPESIRDAEYLKRVLRGELLVNDPARENIALAIVQVAITVARSAPADMTAAQIARFLAPSVGSHAGSLPGVIEMARAKASSMPPLFAAPARALGAEPVKDEFVLKKSGDDAGQPVPSAQHNFRVALQRFGVAFRYNAFAAAETIVRNDTEHIVEDYHVNALSFEIESKWNFFPPTDKFFRFCSTVARESTYHPVLDYLNSRPPDAPAGSPPNLTERWLIDYGGAPDTEYVRAVSRIVLVAAVRRVRQPGCKFDEMLILESGQGKGKSTALRALVPNQEWFSDDFRLDANESRKMIEQTAGHWIVEAGELRGLNTSDYNALKQYLSRQEDKARMAYDRKMKYVKRQFILIGTVNDEQYLMDPNGEDRRFWPVAIVEFDIAGLAAIRDQLWAEAARLEAENPEQEYIRLDPSLYAAAAAEQRKRRVDDPFEDVLSPALGDVRGRILPLDIYRLCGFHEERVPTPAEKNRISRAIKALGFKRQHLGNGVGGMAWYYVRASDDEERKNLLEVVSTNAGGYKVRVSIPRELAPASQVPPRPDWPVLPQPN